MILYERQALGLSCCLDCPASLSCFYMLKSQGHVGHSHLANLTVCDLHERDMLLSTKMCQWTGCMERLNILKEHVVLATAFELMSTAGHLPWTSLSVLLPKSHVKLGQCLEDKRVKTALVVQLNADVDNVNACCGV